MIKTVNAIAVKAIIKLVISSFWYCLAFCLNVLLFVSGSGGCVCGLGLSFK